MITLITIFLSILFQEWGWDQFILTATVPVDISIAVIVGIVIDKKYSKGK